MGWMVLPLSLLSLFPSGFDSDFASLFAVCFKFKALFVRLCKIEVVLNSTGREKEFFHSVHPVSEWFPILLYWKHVIPMFALPGEWDVQVQVPAWGVSFIRKVFLMLWMRAWTFKLLLAAGLVCSSVFCLRNFTHKLWRSWSLQDTDLVNWHSSFKDFWTKTYWILELPWEVLLLRKLEIKWISYNLWKPLLHWTNISNNKTPVICWILLNYKLFEIVELCF